MRNLKLGDHLVTTVPIDDVKLYDNNPQLHGASQLAMAATMIRRYRVCPPVFVSNKRVVITGEVFVRAAREVGLDEIPVIVMAHLSFEEQRALRISYAKVLEKGDWSPERLREEVIALADCEFDFSASELGMNEAEFDFALNGDGKSREEAPEPVIEPSRSKPPVSRIGDIWMVGPHKVICGDSTQVATLQALMGDERAAAINSDMPWNRKVKGEIGGKGAILHPEFPMASGEMSREEFRDMIRRAFTAQSAFVEPGAIVGQWIDWRSVSDLVAVGEEVFDRLENLAVWVKPSGSMGSWLRSQHELCCLFRSKGGKHANFVQLGKYGRNRTNVWQFPSPSGFGAERKNLKLHPTCKNIDMIAEALRDCTKRKAIVLDAFLGSGTTILAAEKIGRVGRGVELDPYYVDLSVQRIADACGHEAVRIDGASFDEVKSSRVIEG